MYLWIHQHLLCLQSDCMGAHQCLQSSIRVCGYPSASGVPLGVCGNLIFVKVARSNIQQLFGVSFTPYRIELVMLYLPETSFFPSMAKRNLSYILSQWPMAS